MLQPVTWTLPSKYSSTTFAYDNEGNRIKKISSEGTTIYVGETYEIENNIAVKHIFLGANRICSIEQDANDQRLSTNYYHTDHLGSSNLITNAQGAQIQLVEYSPFGEITLLTGTDVTDYKFTGKELDQSTGLYYYGARYYNPALCHFTQADPIIQDTSDPQTLNHFAYCRNNPLIYIDPTGLQFDSFGTGWSDISSSIQNTWSNFTSFASSLNNTLNSWATTAMNNMTAFGQSALQEAQIWGSALETGFNYGANIIIPPGTPVYQGLDWLNRNIADPFYNTLTQPGYNYGQWLYGERNFRNFFGASLDSAWALTGISGAIKGLASSSPSYWRYTGPRSNPTYGPGGQVLNKTWLTRGYEPPYSSMAVAKDKLQLPHMPTSVERVNVPFWRYIAGPKSVTGSPQWGIGGGWQYRVGGW